MRQSLTFAIGGMLLAYAAFTQVARAATETEKVAGIQKGLAYLYNSQHSEGYWRVSGDEQAATGAAAFAFLSQQDKWGNNGAEYQVAVDKAIAYLVSTANTMTVSTRKDGVNMCFGGTGSCRGVYWFGNAKSTFATGLVAPAIAAYGIRVGSAAVATTSGPLAGMTWNEIAQAITNALAASQLTSGGWGSYIPGNGDSDSSNTQWAVMALIYNETLGAITHSSAKSNLEGWLGNIQQSSGAVCSQPGSEQC